MVKIEELPDFPALRDIASALWGKGEIRGAAAMIGAGFSRFAELPTTESPAPPLWSDFSAAMAEELYPGDVSASLSNPIRLADEYLASRGASALDALIRSKVRDANWEPSETHRSFLRLPWSDVLTTNWDTLLERTVDPDRDHHYEVVLSQEDIPRTRSPRIVKLHGSFPILKPCVFTEEDFRRYPLDHAPFVNLAQQVLLENELCLLGFSGDDPNFLAWSGWVRDHLGPNARKIHLVGIFDMPRSQRTLLNERNISVIDLSPLVASVDPKLKYRKATEAFLEFLASEKPAPAWEWKRKSTEELEKLSIEQVAREWEKERKEYPGWICAPNNVRSLLRREVGEQASRITSALENDDLSLSVKEILMENLIWRMQVSFANASSGFYCELETFITEKTKSLSRTALLSAKFALLQRARRTRDQECFDRLAFDILKDCQTKDETAFIEYERCLWGISNLHYEFVKARLEHVAGDDPIWSIRKAKAAASIGEFDIAHDSVVAAYDELRRRRSKDRRSIWIKSRLAIAHFLLRNFWWARLESAVSPFEKWPHEYSVAECDPWDELRNLEFDVADEERRDAEDRRPEKPLFDPGRQLIISRGQRFVADWVVTPHHKMTCFIEQAGLFEAPHAGVYSGVLGRAATLLPVQERNTIWAHVEALRSNEGLIEEQFGRISVANLEIGLVGELVDALKPAIEYGGEKLLDRNQNPSDQVRSHLWPERVRWQIELLSRLAVRLPIEANKELFLWALELGASREFEDWWLFKPLGNLLDRTLSGLPHKERAKLVGPALDFPLPSERNTRGPERDWPEIFGQLIPSAKFVERMGDEWSVRIAQLCEALKSSDETNQSHAAVRFLLLLRSGVLSEREKKQLMNAVKELISQFGGLPRNSQLLATVWIELLGDDGRDSLEHFRCDVVAPLTEGQLDPARLSALNFSQSAQFIGEPVELTCEDALRIAEFIIGMKQWEALARPFERDNTQIYFEAAKLLAMGLFPKLSDSDQAAGLAAKTIEAVRTGRLPLLVMSLPILLLSQPTLLDDCLNLIRRRLIDPDPDVSLAAIFAVRQWVELASEELKFPPVLGADIMNICSSRSGQMLHAALELSRRLIDQGFLHEEELTRAEYALDILLLDSDYSQFVDSRLSATTLTLVRKECIRLAHSLVKVRPESVIANKWIKVCETDPLPEVRLAQDYLEVQG